MNTLSDPLPDPTPAILHVCRREMLRPLRDQILRLSRFHVDSTLSAAEGLSMFWARHYDLVLIDVEGDEGIAEAEHLCSEIKTAQHGQLVAFVCNWRVAILTDCPDEIVRTEFNPAAFVEGGPRRRRKTLKLRGPGACATNYIFQSASADLNFMQSG